MSVVLLGADLEDGGNDSEVYCFELEYLNEIIHDVARRYGGCRYSLQFSRRRPVWGI